MTTGPVVPGGSEDGSMVHTPLVASQPVSVLGMWDLMVPTSRRWRR